MGRKISDCVIFSLLAGDRVRVGLGGRTLVFIWHVLDIYHGATQRRYVVTIRRSRCN